MSAAGRWADLGARMGSGAVMLGVGLGAVWAGGHAFHVFIAAICGLMVWELVAMISPAQRTFAMQIGAVSGAVLLLAIYLPAGLALPLLFLPTLIGMSRLERYRLVYLAYGLMVLLAGYGMMQVRDDFGFVWMLWLAAVVVITDVAGYFAGRMIGGPKFWPRISPKKTWSGTVAGWIGAVVLGYGFMRWGGANWQILGISAAVAMASQMGDIAESAIKRRMNVKDSSHLIPGHGGLLDRFDGMLGAALFILLVGQLIGFPPEAF